MITVYVTKEGYYIQGEGVEATLRCSPALDDQGHPIFHELHHTYKVMYLALREVARKETIQGDVMVYNDSRIVDELNGKIQPLDDVCRTWQRVIRRELVPHIRSVVMFRKKHAEFIARNVRTGQCMLTPQDPALISELAERAQRLETTKAQGLKARVYERFRKMWTHE